MGVLVGMTVAKSERTIKGSGANYSAIAAAVALALPVTALGQSDEEIVADTRRNG